MMSESNSDRPKNAPGIQLDLSSLDAEDISRLMDSLKAHVRGRSVSLEIGSNEIQPDILQAVCLTLIIGPPELGLEPTSAPFQEQTLRILGDTNSNSIPEARVCQLWLACAVGEAGFEAADELIALAGEPLWNPVQALAYRSLAYFGRRDILTGLLPSEEPIHLYQADACLEATHTTDIDNDWLKHLLLISDDLLSPEIRSKWLTLLTAEVALAFGKVTRETEDSLVALLPLVNDRPPQTFSEAESRRIAIRAAAAVVRLRVAQRRDDGGVLTSPAGQMLPAWEREYLQALENWQSNNIDKAVATLQASLASNPYQTPNRLALAALLVASSPDTALSVLEHNKPTREMFSLQATLLARLGRYSEAENVLAYFYEKHNISSEPARYSWARGRVQYQQRVQVLQAALTERRGNWSEADKAWESVYTDVQHKTILDTRHFFVAHRELGALATSQVWKRDLVKQRLKRWLHELGNIPLVGNALFFRAIAVEDHLPKRAVKDFLALLRRRAWLEAEGRVGSGRIVCVGDALLRLEQIQDAMHAYEIAIPFQQLEVKERLAVARVYTNILGHAEPKVIVEAADRAQTLAPTSPWPQVFAALGLLMEREPESALAHLEAAEARGAPEPICRCVRSLCFIISGTPVTMTDEELTALRLPKKVEATIHLICGTGSELARMEAFVHAFGEAWITHCPIDPVIIARQLLTVWCDNRRWSEALQFVDDLTRSGVSWAMELATLVRVRYALDRAFQGELKEAEQMLHELDVTL